MKSIARLVVRPDIRPVLLPYTKNPANRSGGACSFRGVGFLVLVPQRAQSCRPAGVAVMMVDVHVVKNRTHVKY